MKELHKLYDFMEARERLNTVITKTKLIHSSVFSKETGNDVYIKPENLQRTGSFKLRGAYNKIAKLTEEEKKKGVIASSAGNHAQGVALAAQKLGIKAVIVMPKYTPLIKVEATRQYGQKLFWPGKHMMMHIIMLKNCRKRKDMYLFILLMMMMLWKDRELLHLKYWRNYRILI